MLTQPRTKRCLQPGKHQFPVTLTLLCLSLLPTAGPPCLWAAWARHGVGNHGGDIHWQMGRVIENSSMLSSAHGPGWALGTPNWHKGCADVVNIPTGGHCLHPNAFPAECLRWHHWSTQRSTDTMCICNAKKNKKCNNVSFFKTIHIALLLSEEGGGRGAGKPNWNSRLQISHSLHVTVSLFPRSLRGNLCSTAAAVRPFSHATLLPRPHPPAPSRAIEPTVFLIKGGRKAEEQRVQGREEGKVSRN